MTTHLKILNNNKTVVQTDGQTDNERAGQGDSDMHPSKKKKMFAGV